MSANPTLRPRTRRLISIEDSYDQSSESQVTAASSSSSSSQQRQQASPDSRALQNAVSSAFSGARAPSPLPAKHPSRGTLTSAASSQQHPHSNARSFGLQIPARQQNKSPSIWESSWAGLQGVASTLLGNNVADPGTPVTPGGSVRKSAAGKGGAHRRNYSLSVPGEPWGPAPESDAPMTIESLASGSREERLAKVQTEKRKKLLAGMGDDGIDTLGRYKRRNSLERRDSIPSPTLGSDDALVYVHKVRPSDSVAGLSVRYNCSQAVVRKTNRLWANDSIQIRKVAYLPVDACAIRGIKIGSPGQKDVELLGGTEDIAAVQNGDTDYHIADTTKQHESSAPTDEQPWVHDSWVQLPSCPDPVEIGRMPRRMLGWFPPARRKSTHYSDTSPPESVTSDIPPPNTNPTPGSLTQLHIPPNRTSSPARPNRPSRANSGTSRLNPSFQPSMFRGSGGVGSLHSNVRGPAPDELNKFVATHLPLLSIQGPDSPIPKTHATPRSVTAPLRPGTAGPRMSFDRVSNLSATDSVTSVEVMAGAVEGWLRKAGGKVKGSLGTPEMRGRGRANTAEGDLIELTDSWELNGSPARTPRGGDAWESEGHGVLDRAGMALAVGVNGKGKAGSGNGSTASVSAREEEERLLRERFPPVGKVFEAGAKR